MRKIITAQSEPLDPVFQSLGLSLQFQLHLSKVSVMFTNKTIVMKMVIFFFFYGT